MTFVVDGRNLSQRYGRRLVFQRLSLTVSSGVTALLGPNGAGKTTLLHTLIGLRPAVAGELTVLGADMVSRRGRRTAAAHLGFLPQSVGYYPGYTVRDFIAYCAWLKSVEQGTIAQRVNEVLDLVDLSDRAGSRMKTLSGGMLRRAGIAQSIVNSPQLLVLDEPASGLDPQQRIELRRLIRRLGEDCSVLLSTHVVEDVRQVADRVLVLNAGRIAFDGTVDELEARASDSADGDSELEKGYLTVLRGSARVAR